MAALCLQDPDSSRPAQEETPIWDHLSLQPPRDGLLAPPTDPGDPAPPQPRPHRGTRPTCSRARSLCSPRLGSRGATRRVLESART